MALINCPYCGAKVSDKAKHCPKCDNIINYDSNGAFIQCADCRRHYLVEFDTCPYCGCPRPSNEDTAGNISPPPVAMTKKQKNFTLWTAVITAIVLFGAIFGDPNIAIFPCIEFGILAIILGINALKSKNKTAEKIVLTSFVCLLIAFFIGCIRFSFNNRDNSSADTESTSSSYSTTSSTSISTATPKPTATPMSEESTANTEYVFDADAMIVCPEADSYSKYFAIAEEVPEQAYKESYAEDYIGTPVFVEGVVLVVYDDATELLGESDDPSMHAAACIVETDYGAVFVMDLTTLLKNTVMDVVDAYPESNKELADEMFPYDEETFDNYFSVEPGQSVRLYGMYAQLLTNGDDENGVIYLIYGLNETTYNINYCGLDVYAELGITLDSTNLKTETIDELSDYEYAFVRSGSEYSMYYLFDTDNNTVRYFLTNDADVLVGSFTGDLESGITMTFTDDGIEWTETFSYPSGSTTAVLYDSDGFDWEYEKTDVVTAEAILNDGNHLNVDG